MKSTTILATAIIAASFYGAINWKPVNTLSEANAIRIAAKSIGVGVRDTADGFQSRCNYWVLDQEKRYVIANGHCIDDPKKDPIVFVTFTDTVMPVICSKIVAYSQWELLDYLVLECQSDLPKALPIAKRPPEQFEKLVHISHNCNYYVDSQCKVEAMYDATNDCQITDYRSQGGKSMESGCDALGGSSGSPYLTRIPNENGELEVIGLYNSAHFFPDSRGDNGFGEGNYAVRIDIIMAELTRKGIFDKDEPVEEPKEPVDNSVEDVDKRSPIEIILDSLWIIIKNLLILFKA